MTTYTVTAQRAMAVRRPVWALQCKEYPGAISEVYRLDQAGEYMREAIAFVADVPEQDVDIRLQIDLPDESYLEHLDRAEEQRRREVQARQDAAREYREAAEILRGSGLSVRDVGTVLGVSYQRVQQLTAAS